jgi:hypothetical protein
MVVKVSKPEINVREKISELDKPSGTAGQAMLAAETPQEQFNLISAGRRNLLINGAFEVFQRGAGPASPSSGNTPSTADKWNIPATNEVSEVVANDRASHLTKMLKVTANSSGYGQVTQWIENVRTAAGQSLTVSFWVKSPTTGAMRFHIYQSFGSGGSTSVAIIDDSNYFTIKQANIWQRFEATVEIPSVSGKTIGANSFLAVQTGAPSAIANRVVYYSEFQAELGKVATPFEHRSYGEELALCQRYFEMIEYEDSIDQNGSVAAEMLIGNGFAYTGGRTLNYLKFNVQKRTPPVVTINTASYYQVLDSNAGWVPANLVNTRANIHGTRIDAYVAGNVLTPGRALEVRLLANGKISIDAEL